MNRIPYNPPRPIQEWSRDIPDGELYEFIIYDDRRVCAASGRYSHGSGSTFCSRAEFLDGELNQLVEETVGREVLREARELVKQEIGE